MTASISQLTVDSTAAFVGSEGQFLAIHDGRKITHGKILKVDSETTITVKWYIPWQWFWVKRWVYFIWWVYGFWE